MKQIKTVGDALELAEQAMEEERYEDAQIYYTMILKTIHLHGSPVPLDEELAWGNHQELN